MRSRYARTGSSRWLRSARAYPRAQTPGEARRTHDATFEERCLGFRIEAAPGNRSNGGFGRPTEGRRSSRERDPRTGTSQLYDPTGTSVSAPAEIKEVHGA